MQGCYLPYLYLPVSLLLPPIHCLALPFWLILASTSDPGRLLGPSSHASSGPALDWDFREGSNGFWAPHLLPMLSPSWANVGTPHIAHLGMALRPQSFYRHADIHVGELPGLCLSWHLGSSSHPLCSQPAPKPISRAERPQPSPCVVPAGSTYPPPSATAARGTGSPCTTHLGSGSKPACLRLLHLWGAGPSCRCPSSSSGYAGALQDCAVS